MSMCKAVIRINDDTASCELEAPHPGMAHHAVFGGGLVSLASADWISDGEARAAGRKTKVDRARSIGVDA